MGTCSRGDDAQRSTAAPERGERRLQLSPLKLAGVRPRDGRRAEGSKLIEDAWETADRLDNGFLAFLATWMFAAGNATIDDATVQSAIASATQRLNGQGRVIVRASGTEPVIRVTGEGDDPNLVEEVVDGIVDAVAQVAAG
jgi:hypothetical protein